MIAFTRLALPLAGLPAVSVGIGPPLAEPDAARACNREPGSMPIGGEISLGGHIGTSLRKDLGLVILADMIGWTGGIGRVDDVGD